MLYFHLNKQEAGTLDRTDGVIGKPVVEATKISSYGDQRSGPWDGAWPIEHVIGTV